MDKCPKCGKNLSIFYAKPNCPECGCDILFYEMDKRLEEDAIQAEKEFAILDSYLEKGKRILEKLKKPFARKNK